MHFIFCNDGIDVGSIRLDFKYLDKYLQGAESMLSLRSAPSSFSHQQESRETLLLKPHNTFIP